MRHLSCFVAGPLATACLVLLGLDGCASSYMVPGGPADMAKLGVTPEAKAALTDSTVRQALAKQPLATFPATIAIGRVQASGYASFSYRSPQSAGAYSVITNRDIEKDEDFAAVAALPQVANVVTLKRILFDRPLSSDLELRAAAAKLHADMLLIYTFDTTFYTDTALQPLTLLSLGLFPNKDAKVTSTASAVLMDVNNGYLYAVMEATSSDHQLANAWSNDDAVDEVRRRTERDAFEKLLGQFKKEWVNVVVQYAPHPTTSHP